MKNAIKLLGVLIIFLLSGDLMAQTTTNPDSVCLGSTSEMYWINSNPNSTYLWSIDPNTGAVIVSGSNTNSIIVDWSLSNPGLYLDAITLIETDISSTCSNFITLDVEVLPLPTTTIGPDVIACEGGLIPDLTAIGSQVTWYSDAGLNNQVGTGNNYATGQTLQGIYTYYATETLNGCEGPSIAITLTIEAAPTADAGISATICEGDSYTLSNASATNTSGVVWSSTGDGQFDNINAANPIYTPGPNDILNGTVDLTLTANGNGNCLGVSDNITITINQAAIAVAGPDADICEGDSYTLSNASATNTSGVVWSSTGDGQFDNINAINPVYTPGPNDILNGTVDLTLTANGNGNCLGISDNITITINTIPNPSPIQHN